MGSGSQNERLLAARRTRSSVSTTICTRSRKSPTQIDGWMTRVTLRGGDYCLPFPTAAEDAWEKRKCPDDAYVHGT